MNKKAQVGEGLGCIIVLLIMAVIAIAPFVIAGFVIVMVIKFLFKLTTKKDDKKSNPK